jgi:hypothetical protein
VEGARFELPFEGTGWTFLGEQANKAGIAYDSRRFEGTNLVFVLNPVKVGEYTLRFQRQDSLRGVSYEELVEVSVAPKSAAPSSAAPPAASSLAAPSASVLPAGSAVAASPSAAPAAPAVSVAAAAIPSAASSNSAAAKASPAAVSTSPASAAASPSSFAPASAGAAPAIDPASLTTPEAALATARSELAAERPQGALIALDRLSALAPEGSDEACILYARALEKNGPLKDIKRAYSYYRKLRDSYPESAFWDEADARCSYIERRYFDIR